jgi:hypothetical protein
MLERCFALGMPESRLGDLWVEQSLGISMSPPRTSLFEKKKPNIQDLQFPKRSANARCLAASVSAFKRKPDAVGVGVSKLGRLDEGFT